MEQLLLALMVRQIPGLRMPERLLLLETVASPGNLLGLSPRQGAEILGRFPAEFAWEPARWFSQAGAVLASLDHTGIWAVSYWDSGYPPQLREIYDPPLVLFYRGTLPDYDRPLAGVVGTRYPTGRGRKAAFRFGLELGLQGLGVVSGLARGIDQVAHQGNLAGKGRTVAVMAGGLDRIYPGSSEGTAREILLQGGCLFSEYPPGTPPARFQFPARNRIISGLSRGVVIIEAPVKSGALITADFALEQGRDLWVHRLCQESPAGEGGRQLLLQGIPGVENPGEILADWWEKPLFYDKDKNPSEESRSISRAALAMEAELTGNRVFFEGEYFRR